jgi:hypothetical protein
VPIAVYLSPRAGQQVSMLRARDRRTYDDFLINLRARGCEAMHYRLTGDVLLERLCVVHLARQLRVVVAFESAESVTILLVAPHKDDDPFIDIYAQLYRLANLARELSAADKRRAQRASRR